MNSEAKNGQEEEVGEDRSLRGQWKEVQRVTKVERRTFFIPLFHSMEPTHRTSAGTS